MDIHIFIFWFSTSLLIAVVLALIALLLQKLIYLCKYKKVTNTKTEVAETFEFDLEGDHQAIHTPIPASQ